MPKNSRGALGPGSEPGLDRKSTRLNSSHTVISYAVFCLKKKKRHVDDYTVDDGTRGPISTEIQEIFEYALHGRSELYADLLVIFFFNDTATTEIYTLSLHDALPI